MSEPYTVRYNQECAYCILWNFHLQFLKNKTKNRIHTSSRIYRILYSVVVLFFVLWVEFTLPCRCIIGSMNVAAICHGKTTNTTVKIFAKSQAYVRALKRNCMMFLSLLLGLLSSVSIYFQHTLCKISWAMHRHKHSNTSSNKVEFIKFLPWTSSSCLYTHLHH